MSRAMLRINLLLAIAILTLVSCRTARPVVTTTSDKKDSSSIAEKETILSKVYLPDSALIEALLKCDSLGNVYIAEISQIRAGGQVKPEIIIRDNYIKVTCKVDSLLIYQMYSHRINTSTSMETDKKVEIQKPPGSSWQWFIILPFLVAIAYVIYRFKLFKIFR